MTAVERPAHVARLRAARMLRDVGAELRAARLATGRSQREIAAITGIPPSKISRIELDQEPNVALVTASVLASAVGLDLSVRLFRSSHEVRDAGQLRLLERLRERLGGGWTWRFEVPVRADDQRAWDAVGHHRDTGMEVHVEAETRITDIQAVLRKLASKREASDPGRAMLLVADTHRNRDAFVAGQMPLRSELPCSTRAALGALSIGRDPGADCLVMLAVPASEPGNPSATARQRPRPPSASRPPSADDPPTG